VSHEKLPRETPRVRARLQAVPLGRCNERALAPEDKGDDFSSLGFRKSAMAFKLIESAQARWRAVNAPHLVALVRAGARFENGKLVERPDESGGEAQVA